MPPHGAELDLKRAGESRDSPPFGRAASPGGVVVAHIDGSVDEHLAHSDTGDFALTRRQAIRARGSPINRFPESLRELHLNELGTRQLGYAPDRVGEMARRGNRMMGDARP